MNLVMRMLFCQVDLEWFKVSHLDIFILGHIIELNGVAYFQI